MEILGTVKRRISIVLQAQVFPCFLSIRVFFSINHASHIILDVNKIGLISTESPQNTSLGPESAMFRLGWVCLTHLNGFVCICDGFFKILEFLRNMRLQRKSAEINPNIYRSS